MKKICPICNSEFEAPDNRKIYCSDKCRQRGHYLRNIKPKQVKLDPSEYPIKECILCGKTFQLKSAQASKRLCCYECAPENIQLTRGDFLARLKFLRGGKCIRCGYNKCMKALNFHHLDPEIKDFTISNDHFKLQEAIKESRKCILLCANCHAELHDKLWYIEDLKLEESEEVES